MMKVLLVDDEEPAIERMSRLMDRIDGFSVVGTGHTGQEAVKKTISLNPDIVILDIRMPIMDGIEAARHICELDMPPAIIFSTAYDDYALEAYGVKACDYILKPISEDRLKEALDKAISPNQALIAHLNEQNNDNTRQFISARSGKQLDLIPVNEIHCFVADQKYIRVIHTNGEVLIEESLKSLEAEFEQTFTRIHRNALVATKEIHKLEKTSTGYLLHLRHVEQPLEVSRRALPNLKKAMNQLSK